MTSIRLDWPVLSRDDWADLIGRCPRSNVFQTWDYGKAVAAEEGHKPRHGLIRDGRRIVGLVQVFVKNRFGVAATAKVVRGPLFLKRDPAPDIVADAIREIKRGFPLWKRQILQIMPEVTEGPVAEAVTARCNLTQVKTGYTTAWLDLTPDGEALRAGLDQKWRNQLRAAEKAGVVLDATTDAAARAWLLEQYERHKAETGYTGPSAALLGALPLADLSICRAMQDGAPVAGALFVRHGRCATYEVGWTGPEGRETNAHNRVIWEALLALKQAGVETVDLGGLDDTNAPGVARFKRGLGGREETLMGTFV